MTPPPCPRPGCDHALVTTRDALGRARVRRVCDGVGLAGATQPARHVPQTPGALKLDQRAPLLPAPAPVVADLWNVPAARRPHRPRPDRPCVVCGTMVPQGPTGPRSSECDDCCPPGTREVRERRRADVAARRAPTRDPVGFPVNPLDVRSLLKRSGGAA